MSKILIEAYIEEKNFINDKGDNVNFLSLSIPVTDNATKTIKVDQFVLQLAKERAEKKQKNVFGK